MELLANEKRFRDFFEKDGVSLSNRKLGEFLAKMSNLTETNMRFLS